MDMTVMDLPIAANNMGIVTLPRITPLHMDRHNMVIHIIHTATHGKGIRSRVKRPLGENKDSSGREKIVPTSKEIKNVSNCLSNAGGLIDCGNINSRYTQALELHCGDLLNCHRYSRVGSSLTKEFLKPGREAPKPGQ
jgi:hypothetical protein